MRISLVFPAVCAFLGMISCGRTKEFSGAQPASAPVLNTIPQRLQGRYVATNGESVLNIYPNAMVRIYDFDVKCESDKLPGGYKLVGDTLTIYDYDGFKETQIVERLNDSTIVYHEHLLDSFFVLNPFSVLKEDKGYYFLNEHIQVDSNSFIWEVRALALQKSLLTVAYVDDAGALEKLPVISGSPQDTIPVGKKPIRKKYKEFEDEDNIEKVDSFFRVGL